VTLRVGSATSLSGSMTRHVARNYEPEPKEGNDHGAVYAIRGQQFQFQLRVLRRARMYWEAVVPSLRSRGGNERGPQPTHLDRASSHPE
jgi:hypothetical protein